MVDTGLLENYLNDSSVKEGEVVKIAGEGNIEQKEDAITKKKYSVLNLPVVLANGRTLTYSPNIDAQKVLKAKFGTDTKNWVGKEFKVKFYPKTSFGVTKNAILPVVA